VSGTFEVSDIDLVQKQQGLTVGASGTIEVMVAVDVDLLQCESLQYLCVVLTSYELGSYTEINMDNNFFCLDITLNKECHPGKISWQSTIRSNYMFGLEHSNCCKIVAKT